MQTIAKYTTAITPLVQARISNIECQEDIDITRATYKRGPGNEEAVMDMCSVV